MIAPKPGTINDAACAQYAREVCAEALGKEHISCREPWMASETMAVTLMKFPGVFAFLGTNNPEKGTGADQRNGRFDIDEDVLKYCVAAHVAYAMSFSEHGPETASRRCTKPVSEIY